METINDIVINGIQRQVKHLFFVGENPVVFAIDTKEVMLLKHHGYSMYSVIECNTIKV